MSKKWIAPPPFSFFTLPERNEPSFIKVRFFIRVFRDIFSLLGLAVAMKRKKKKVEWFLVTLCFKSRLFSKFCTATALAAHWATAFMFFFFSTLKYLLLVFYCSSIVMGILGFHTFKNHRFIFADEKKYGLYCLSFLFFLLEEDNLFLPFGSRNCKI